MIEIPSRNGHKPFNTWENPFEEGEDSLQLPIYYLLATNLQNRNVEKASYWYLDKDDEPIPMTLPDVNEARERVLEVAIRIKETREACPACRALVKSS